MQTISNPTAKGLCSSETFKIQVLALNNDDTGNLQTGGKVSFDDEKTVVKFDNDNITITAPQKADNKGNIYHEIDFGNKKVKAISNLANSKVDITDNGVKTTYEDNTINLKAEVNATITGKAIHSLDVNGIKTTARSEFIGAQTLLKNNDAGDIIIETNIDINNTTKISVQAKEDGTAEHTLSKNGKITKASSKIKGAQTLITNTGSVETKVKTNQSKIIDGNTWIMEAIAKTSNDGTTITTYQLRNTITDEIREAKNTFIPSTPYDIGNEVEILELNGKTYMKTRAPISSKLIVE